MNLDALRQRITTAGYDTALGENLDQFCDLLGEMEQDLNAYTAVQEETYSPEFSDAYRSILTRLARVYQELRVAHRTLIADETTASDYNRAVHDTLTIAESQVRTVRVNLHALTGHPEATEILDYVVHHETVLTDIQRVCRDIAALGTADDD